MINLGSAYGEIQIGTDKAQQSVQSLAQTMRNVGQTMTTTLSLPILGVAAAGLNAAAGFEQSMNQIQVVGGVAADAMSTLNAKALQLGAETSFSAGEAADGMLELAKAGMDADDVMSSISGTLDLAAAGNLGVGQAAEITANALNSFGLPAEEATRVANLLAAAANSSSVEVTDMAQAFAMSGSVFGANKVPIDQLAASIAILGNNGLKGSDAGTTLKTLLMRLTSPTKDAAGVMQELGLQVYNADGSMRNFQDIVADLGAATAGLTDEQRNMALTTVFGADAIRAANILIKEGAGEYENMMTAVNKEGAATEVANARMKGLAGAIQYIKGTIESLMIGAFQPFLQGLGDMIRGVADAMAAFGQLPQPVINAVMAFLGVLGVAGPVILAMGQIGAVMGALLNPVGLVILAIGALAAAFAADFMGIRSAAMQMAGTLGDLWTAMLWIFQGQADNIDWWWDIAEAFGFTGDAAMAVGDTLFALGVKVGSVVDAFRSFGADAIGEIIAQLTGFGLETYDTTEAIESLVGALTGSAEMGSAAGEWIFNLGTTFQNLRERVGEAVQAMLQGFAGLGPQLTRLQEAFGQLAAAVMPILQGLAVVIAAVFGVVSVVAINGFLAVMENLPAAIGVVIDTLATVIGGVATVVSNMVAGVTALMNGDFAGAWQAAQGIVSGVMTALLGIVGGFVGMVGIAWAALKSTIVGTLETLGFTELAAQIDGIAGKVESGWLQIKDSVTVAVQNFSWADFVEVFTWDNVVKTALNWADYIKSLDWGGYIATALDWAAFIGQLAWSNVFVPALEWAAYVTPIAWDALVTALSDWGAYIAALDWTTIITTAIDWATWVPALAWNTFVTILDWATIVAAFAWTEYISPIDWSSTVSALSWADFVTALGDWGSYIVSIDWAAFITKLADWAVFIGAFTWESFVSKLKWPLIAQFNWSEWVVKLAWPVISWPGFNTFVKALVWPPILWPGFTAFVKNLVWPSISWPGWASFIPKISLPSIPPFPGWAALLDALNPLRSRSAEIPTKRSGLDWLTTVPESASRMIPAATAAAGGQTINLSIEVGSMSSALDIEELAWRIEKRLGRAASGR